MSFEITLLLDISIRIVAADLWNREQVVLASGDLISAINASMATPGVFEQSVPARSILKQ